MISAAVLALHLISSMPAVAPGPARSALTQFSTNLKNLTGDFSQQTVDSSGQTGELNTGILMMQAPRQLRWDYESPFEQRIVADGKRIWVYDIDLEQISVRAQSEDEASSPLAILLDLSKLDEQFVVLEGGVRDGAVWLVLEPRLKDPQFKQAELGFRDNALSAMRVYDSLGNRSEFSFEDWRRNVKLAPDTFVFVPPPGVDVVGDTELSLELQTIKD